MTTPDEKLRELILYISLRSEGDEWFGATKLNLLLFYIDVESLRLFGQALTGQEYEQQPYGPAPRGIRAALAVLRDSGALVVRGPIAGPYVQHRPFALRAPDLDGFQAAEIALVEAALQRFRARAASEMCVLAHQFHAWQLAPPGETIPIASGLVANRQPTREEWDYAGTLTDRLPALSTDA